jgi:2-phosphoglycerate kinase
MNDTKGRPWQVLLIGGVSGTGKSLVSEALGKRFGVSWLQVDDVRLTLQYSGLLRAEQQPDLFYFLQHEDFHSHAPDILLEKQIAVAQVITPAISIVIDHHVATSKPIILEGDGILPGLAAQRRSDAVRAVFLTEADEEALYHNMMARGRRMGALGTTNKEIEEQRRNWIRHTWRFNKWLEDEAKQYGLPVVQSRPWETLTERILMATDYE